MEEMVSHCYLVESTLRECLTDNFLPPSKVLSWFTGAEMTCPVKKKKKKHKYLVKSLLSHSLHEYNIDKHRKVKSDASFARGAQLFKDLPTAFGSARGEKWSQGENVINLKAAAQSIRAKDKERSRKKNRWSAFTIRCFSTQDWSFLFPVPHRVRRQRLVSVVCLGSCIVVFTWGQSCFDKTLVVVWFGSLVVKGWGLFYDGGCLPDAKNTTVC